MNVEEAGDAKEECVEQKFKAEAHDGEVVEWRCAGVSPVFGGVVDVSLQQDKMGDSQQAGGDGVQHQSGRGAGESGRPALAEGPHCDGEDSPPEPVDRREEQERCQGCVWVNKSEVAVTLDRGEDGHDDGCRGDSNGAAKRQRAGSRGMERDIATGQELLHANLTGSFLR